MNLTNSSPTKVTTKELAKRDFILHGNLWKVVFVIAFRPEHWVRLGDVAERFRRDLRPSLEAQIANLADELAYNNHDIDDGLRSGLITIEQLQMLEIFADVPEALENTVEIANKVEFYDIDSAPMMPVFPIPEDFGTEEEYRNKFTEEMLREAAKMAVCKINIDSDLRLAMTAAIRKHMAENPTHFDPRQYLAPARTAIEDMVAHKIQTVLGCAGKA